MIESDDMFMQMRTSKTLIVPWRRRILWLWKVTVFRISRLQKWVCLAYI